MAEVYVIWRINVKLYVYKMTKVEWGGIPHGRVGDGTALDFAICSTNRVREMWWSAITSAADMIGNVDMTWQPRKCIYFCRNSGLKASEYVVQWVRNFGYVYDNIVDKLWIFFTRTKSRDTALAQQFIENPNPNPNCPETEQLTASLNAGSRLFTVTFLIWTSQPSLLC